MHVIKEPLDTKIGNLLSAIALVSGTNEKWLSDNRPRLIFSEALCNFFSIVAHRKRRIYRCSTKEGIASLEKQPIFAVVPKGFEWIQRRLLFFDVTFAQLQPLKDQA